MTTPPPAPRIALLPLQYELHLTALTPGRAVPPGFACSRVRNYDGAGVEVQCYELLTRRYQRLEQVPWELEGAFERFKLERKLAVLPRGARRFVLNQEYLENPEEARGIEIHVLRRPRQSSGAAGMLSSTVDRDRHSTVFLERREPMSAAALNELIGRWCAAAWKAHLEAVLADTMPELDRRWRSSCA